MKKDDFEEELLKQQVEVMAYEGKIPCKPFVWFCPKCENLNIDRFKRAEQICFVCKKMFSIKGKDNV